MNITVNVDEISLDTAIAAVFEYDSDGSPYQKGERTVADLVAEQITARLAKDARYPALLDQLRDIRAEVIREAVRPQIEQALAAPVQKMNTFGEPMSLRDLIVAEARKAVNEPADRYSSRGGSFLEQAVEKAVKDALGAEIKDALEKARKSVAGEIGKTVAAAVDAGLKAR
jgi:hypothetical protein